MSAAVPSAQHSAKPSLDALLRPAARHLLQERSGHAGASARARRASSPPDDDDDDAAWRSLPKVELFAREVRPHWHAVGDEAIHFQHESFFREEYWANRNDRSVSE